MILFYFYFFIAMVAISCYYNHYNRDPINFTFIKYETYIKVILNDRSIIITIEQLVSNYYLFQIYILSLLCTEDTETIGIENGNIYGVFTQWYWKNLYFTNYFSLTELYKSNTARPKNPFKSQEPKRISSCKKIKKFTILFDSYLRKMKDPIILMDEFYLNEFKDIKESINKCIKYEMKINILSGIFHKYGRDIYSSIKNKL